MLTIDSFLALYQKNPPAAPLRVGWNSLSRQSRPTGFRTELLAVLMATADSVSSKAASLLKFRRTPILYSHECVILVRTRGSMRNESLWHRCYLSGWITIFAFHTVLCPKDGQN